MSAGQLRWTLEGRRRIGKRLVCLSTTLHPAPGLRSETGNLSRVETISGFRYQQTFRRGGASLEESHGLPASLPGTVHLDYVRGAAVMGSLAGHAAPQRASPGLRAAFKPPANAVEQGYLINPPRPLEMLHVYRYATSSGPASRWGVSSPR